ncbi:MAG TPA: TRAP transporter large permease [Burkholderiaceae bacterium]|nr:TRAP transporter large permease [Burkholderiaceae bacterium]
MSIGVALMLFATMLGLMALRVPVWLAMFVPGAVGYCVLSGAGALLAHLKGIAFARFSIYDLSVIPLFLLMGQLATQGGLSRALFRAATSFVGHWRGGLAQASVIASAAFGAVCGSSVATAATIAQAALPEMRRYRYDGGFAVAALAAGGTLGILIPPSVVLVLYAIIAEQSIGRLFAAALLPGVLAALLYCIAVAVLMRRRPELGPAEPPVPWAQRWRTLVGVIPLACIFLLVLGGIYGGVFTATEGGAIGVALTGLAGLMRGELRLAGLRAALLATAETSGVIFMIFLGADMLNSALALTQMPARVAELIGALPWPPLAIVAAVLVFYIVLGGVMDELSMLLLTLPVVFPAVMQLELHGLPLEAKGIWFGILLLTVVNIGLIAPPVGLNVYVVVAMARDVPIANAYRNVVPFLVADALRLMLLVLLPALSLWLVQYVR